MIPKYVATSCVHSNLSENTYFKAIPFLTNKRRKKRPMWSVAVGCRFWQLVDHSGVEGLLAETRMERWVGEEVKDQHVLCLLPEEINATLGPFSRVCPELLAPRVSVDGSLYVGGDKRRQKGGVGRECGYDKGQIMPGSQPKSRTCLMISSVM